MSEQGIFHKAPWRTGRKVHRTIYATQRDRQARDSDQLIGVMDTAELAREAVAAHNDRLSAMSDTEDGTPIVLDLRHYPRRVVVGCSSDEQAERIASFLNDEFGGQR